jgi:carbon monoxide dehydrogenase subunit G
MPTVQRSIETAASPETVWSIISDPTLVPKVYPDAVSITSTPPGMAQVGQKNEIVAKVGGRRTHMTTETDEVVPNKKLVFHQIPGGLMKTFVNTTTLEPSKKGTRLTIKTEYEASAGYLGKALSVLFVNRVAKKNLQVSADNIKELAELKELPQKTGG